MIAAQAYDLVRRPFLKINEEFNDPAAIRSAIYIVTQEDQLRPSFARVSFAKLDEALQLVQASVNVTDRVGLAQSEPNSTIQ